MISPRRREHWRADNCAVPLRVLRHGAQDQLMNTLIFLIALECQAISNDFRNALKWMRRHYDRRIKYKHELYCLRFRLRGWQRSRKDDDDDAS